MAGNALPARAQLDAWRAQGDDGCDPIAFHRLVALERRLDAHEGEARRLLEERLSHLIKVYADALAGAPSKAVQARSAPVPLRGPLGALADDLAGRAAQRQGDTVMGGALTPEALPQPAALEDVRRIWAGVRADSQMRRSLQPSAADTGPLNSSSLVHRSLMLMRDLSPGYLQHFLAYVDVLSWLEQMRDGGVVAAGGPSPRDKGTARVRSKPRKRSK